MRRLTAPFHSLAARDPFLVFLLVSGAIFALYWVVTANRETIDVPLSVQKSLSDDYEMMAGKKPDAEAKAKYTSFYYRYERWILPIIVLFSSLVLVTYGPYLLNLFDWYPNK